jgi:hypothetical protein
MKKPKKFNLDCSYEQEFEVLGICSHFPDYRMIWNINSITGLELAKNNDVFENYSKKGQLLSIHDKYSYTDENTATKVTLLKNKVNTAHLAPELAQIDYFLFSSPSELFDIHELRNQIVQNDGIVAAYVLDANDYASLQKINPIG